jgi:hypothetical protein
MAHDHIGNHVGRMRRPRRCTKCGWFSSEFEDRETKEAVCRSCLPLSTETVFIRSDPEDYERGDLRHLYPIRLTKDEIKDGGSFA